MSTHTPWPGLSAVIHHTVHRHTRVALDEVAHTLGMPVATLCAWATAHGIPLYQTAAGLMVERAVIDSALTRRSPQSRPHSRTPYRQ